MTKFPTQYEKHERVYSNPGTEIKIEYMLKYTEDGREELVETGETNFHDYIQSFADSVDLNKMIERFTLGDKSALEKAKGFYADVSEWSGNLAEFLNVNALGKQYFDKLPVNVKELYHNNYVEFLMDPNKLNEINNIDMSAVDNVENIVENEERNNDNQEH